MSTKESNLIENFKKEKNQVENLLLFDKSFVVLSKDKPEKLAFYGLLDSIFNNMVMTCSKLIMTANLILLGHLLYESEVHYQLFLTFQIGVFILEFIGRFFLLGLLKYLFFEQDNFKGSYDLYIKMKSVLVFLVPAIFIPVGLCSYFLIELLLKDCLGVYDENINKEVYKNYLIFTPITYLFEILFFLNIKYLALKANNPTIKYLIGFIICYTGLSWIALYFLNMGIIGLTLSYGINGFIFFFFSDKSVFKALNGSDENYFFLIPNKSNFDSHLLSIFGKTSICALINLGDIIFPAFIFLACVFIDKNQLIVNIIYLNFFELLIEFNRGFYYSIKNVIKKFDDASERQTIIAYFSLYYLILSISIVIILLLFNNILLNIYLLQGGDQILQQISGKLRVIYPICIFCMSLRLLLIGIVRGMDLPLSYSRKIVYIVLSMMICYILCFEYDFEIRGLWISMLIFDLLYVCESGFKTIKYFPLILSYSSPNIYYVN